MYFEYWDTLYSIVSCNLDAYSPDSPVFEKFSESDNQVQLTTRLLNNKSVRCQDQIYLHRLIK